MSLNKQFGNMYDFINYTWNTIKGVCEHSCIYCYMKKFGNQKPVRLDEKEFKINLGKNNYIFVGSSNDMFSKNIPLEWIEKTLKHCINYNNTYLFQSKNPSRFFEFKFPEKTILCTTLESNKDYDNISNAPYIIDRVNYIKKLKDKNFRIMITIEPILDFDIEKFISIINSIKPFQVNIGADSKNHNLPEPNKTKIQEFINGISNDIKIFLKPNLKRIMK